MRWSYDYFLQDARVLPSSSELSSCLIFSRVRERPWSKRHPRYIWLFAFISTRCFMTRSLCTVCLVAAICLQKKPLKRVVILFLQQIETLVISSIHICKHHIWKLRENFQHFLGARRCHWAMKGSYKSESSYTRLAWTNILKTLDLCMCIRGGKQEISKVSSNLLA